MKKIFTYCAALSFAAIAFTSCKKDFTCTCYNSSGVVTGKSIYSQIVKKEASEKCDKFNTGAALTGGWCSIDSKK